MRHTEGNVELRLTAAQVTVPVVLGLALATGLLQLGLRWTADPMTAAELRDCAYAAGAGVVGALVLPRLRGARLTPEYLAAFTAFGQRERRIPWANVLGIDVHRTAGVRSVSVRLVTGECLTLAAPMSFLDRRFDARVTELTDWWESNRR
ncbi:hypothetical protein [Streptomyces sp. AP-93]|uniref:hypothetical protein n=1 Tax=Streptomyces sp. AP-93 TaxID=2929048 RepID=UPI001FAFDCDB|nr:hypothetical protein [Streptomyces sp. AP-93]MCJ0869484.1 hypothetical protein [Streptomyces sp. AP-93]